MLFPDIGMSKLWNRSSGFTCGLLCSQSGQKKMNRDTIPRGGAVDRSMRAFMTFK